MRWKSTGIRIAVLLTLSGVLYGLLLLIDRDAVLREAWLGLAFVIVCVLVFLGELIFVRPPEDKSDRPRFPAPPNRASKHWVAALTGRRPIGRRSAPSPNRKRPAPR